MYGAKPVIRSSSPVRGGAFACCGYLVLDGFAGVCEVWIFPGESLWDGEGPPAPGGVWCGGGGGGRAGGLGLPPPRGGKPAKAARRAAWPAAQACTLQRFAQSGNRPFSHYKIGAVSWRCKRQVEREGTLQEPAQSETRIFGPRTNEGKVGRKNTLQKVPYPAMIKGRTT